jgi:hypothetical protein
MNMARICQSLDRLPDQKKAMQRAIMQNHAVIPSWKAGLFAWINRRHDHDDSKDLR